MEKKTKLQIFLILLFAVVLLYSCKKSCEEHNYGLLELDPSYLSLVPYYGGEELLFEGDSGDTVRLTFEDRMTLSVYRYYEIPNPSVTTDCFGNYYDYEVNNSILVSSDSSARLGLGIFPGNPFKKYPPETRMIIGLWFMKDTLRYAYNGTFEVTAYVPENLTTDGIRSRVVAFHDSIALNGMIFNGIYEFSNNPYDESDPAITRLFYSLSLGVIGFKTYDGQIFSLQSN